MVAQTLAAFAYANENPVNRADPRGSEVTGPDAEGNGFICPPNIGGPVCWATDGWDPFDAIVDWAHTHTGDIVKAVAAGACIVSSAGLCAAWAIAATAADLYQESQTHKWNTENVEGTLLVGMTDVLSAGLVGEIEGIGAKASAGFTETLVYRSVSYSLRVLSVTPSLVVDVSK
jgi:hypothetical protein